MAGRLSKYLSEDGFYVTSLRAIDHLRTRIFNRCISKKIGNPTSLNIHHSALLRGLKHVQIGDNFYSGRMLWLEAILEHGSRKYTPQIVIKNNVAVNDFVHIAATNYVEIGSGVLIASRVFIADHNHGTYQGSDLEATSAPNLRSVSADASVIVADNVWIGESVAILPGSKIGTGCVIGANSVVKGVIPPFSIAVGSPARVIKKYDPEQKGWIRV
jgi:acetyltransferase-like isoleucine patch superfamily enzyme